MGKHAYLIMAHHRPDLLMELIKALDDKRNDIFLHIDKKSNLKKKEIVVSESNLYIIESINVNWGGYSQIESEYKLLEESYSKGPYDYYHFLTGSTFPLKSQDDMHIFFDNNQGAEFVGFDNKVDYSARAKYYFLFNETGKPTTIIKKIKWRVRKIVLSVQNKIKYNRLSADEFKNVDIKKGMAYVSITNDFAKYVLEKKTFVRKLLKYSISGDEIFFQTLVYNSKFRNKIYNFEDEFEGCLREVAWEDTFGKDRVGHNFIYKDLDYLLNSKRCFALKFEGKDGLKLINRIKKEKNIK